MTAAPTFQRASDLCNRFLPLGAILLVFVVLCRVFGRIADLPAPAFFKPVLVIETLKHLPGLNLLVVPLILFVAVVAWKRRLAVGRWDQWGDGHWARLLVIVAAGVLAWPYATYDFNYFLRQWHWIDRGLLVGLFAGICWRPIFVLPFLAVLVPIVAQSGPPLGGFSWAIPDQSIHLLILFASYYVVSLCQKERRMEPFLFLACCVIALHYWPSGYSKIRLGWVFDDRIEFLLPNAYANGWLAFLTPETIVKWTRILAGAGPVLKGFTLVAECGALVFLWHRKVSIGLLVCWFGFHAGIFLVTGICLWQWVVLETALLVVVCRAGPFRTGTLYSKSGMLFAFGLIATSHVWLKPVSLTWFDARATYIYRFYGVGLTGQHYHLPPRFFAPYDYQFTLGGFQYLSAQPVIGITLGATSKPIARRLADARTAEDVLALERELATPVFDPERRDHLVEFVARFVAGANAAPARKTKLRSVHSPRQLWTFGETNAYRFEEPLQRVEVMETLTFYDGTHLQEIRRRPVLTIDIPAASGTGGFPAAAPPVGLRQARTDHKAAKRFDGLTLFDRNHISPLRDLRCLLFEQESPSTRSGQAAEHAEQLEILLRMTDSDG